MTFAWGQKNTFLALNDRINNEQDNEGKIRKVSLINCEMLSFCSKM